MRYLAIPAALALMTLVGLGVSSQDRSEFEQDRRLQQQSQAAENQQQSENRQGSRTSPQSQSSSQNNGDGSYNQTDDPSTGQGDQGQQSGSGEPSETGQAESGNTGSDSQGGTRQGNGSQPNNQVGEGPNQVVINNENGDVTVQFGDGEGDGEQFVVIDSDGNSVPIDQGEGLVVRLGEDGRLEVVPPDEVREGDRILELKEDGFDLVGSDGSRVEFRQNGEDGGVTATEVSPDGTRTPLEPDENGTVTLQDGTEIDRITVIEDSGPIERIFERAAEIPWGWFVVGVVSLVVASLSVAYYLYRNRPEDDFDYSLLMTNNQSTDQFADFLEMLADDPEPTRAVRIGFYSVERGIAGIPPRRQNETPFEWHNRVSVAKPEYDQTLGVICDLFAKARFAPDASTADDQQKMVAQLRDLQRLGNRDAVLTNAAF